MRGQAFLVLPWFAAVSLALAWNASGDATQAARLRPLNAREGRAIVQETAWSDNEEGRTTDCSHLVHDLYEQAGYPYPYASSLDLYNGTGPFVRVRMPQPGDLVVWRGHVGIVMDPKAHSFFSSVTSGARTEYYDSAYWRARGRPRFYRYLTNSPARNDGKTLDAADRPPAKGPKAPADNNGADDRPPLQVVKAASTAEKARGEAPLTSAAGANNTSQIPLRISGRQPQAADVATALEAANLEAGDILRAGDLQQPEWPMVVYRGLQVSGVGLKGKRGTAEVQFETLAALSAEGMQSRRGWEEHPLELQRTKKGWMVTASTKNVYVPRDAALRILAARLALLSQNADASTEREREQANIIRFMNLLIE